MATTLDKRTDLAGPGIGNYEELEQILPCDYRSLLTRRDSERQMCRGGIDLLCRIGYKR